MTRLAKWLGRLLKRTRAKIVGGDEEKPFHPAWGAMQGMVRIVPGIDITQPADPEWAARLDAKYGPEKR
jgi:hypothetical protein